MARPLKVWSRFTVSKENDTIQLRIVEARKESLENVANFIIKHFFFEECIAKATGVLKDEDAIAMYRSQLLNSLQLSGMRMLVCCADNENINEIEEIIGGAFLWLVKDDSPRNVQYDSKILRRFFEVVNATKDWCHIIEELKVKKYYEARMVAVQPKYRGLGIAEEFFKIMPHVFKGDGVPVIVATMTAIGTQKAAAKAGWKTFFEISSEEFGKNTGVTFTEDTPSQFTLMMIKLDQE